MASIWILFPIMFNTFLTRISTASHLPCHYEDQIFDCVGTSVPFDRVPRIPLDATAAFISSNQIKAIRSSDFVDQGNLERLIMNDNLVKQIDDNAFLLLQKLKFLNLDDNKISQLNFYLPPSLQHINLNSNAIKTISPDFLKKMDHLQQLDLSENLLNEIPAKLFEAIQVKQQQITLDFSNNRIQSLQKETISYLIYNSKRYSKLKINLSGNPLHCNCLMKWVSTLSHDQMSHSVSHIDIQGACHSPSELRSLQISQLKHTEFSCTQPSIDFTVRSHVTLDEHHVGAIHCSAKGDPAPLISFRIGQSVWLGPGANQGRYTVTSDGVLKIEPVTLKDARHIQCVASNVVNNDTLDIVITVNQKLSSSEKTKIVAAVVVPLCILAIICVCLCFVFSSRAKMFLKCCKQKRRVRYALRSGGANPAEDFRFPADRPNGLASEQTPHVQPVSVLRNPGGGFNPHVVQTLPLSRTPGSSSRPKSAKSKSGSQPKSFGTMPAALRPSQSSFVTVPQHSGPPSTGAGTSQMLPASDTDRRSILFKKMAHPYVAAGTITNGITVPAKLPATPLYIDPPEFQSPLDNLNQIDSGNQRSGYSRESET